MNIYLLKIIGDSLFKILGNAIAEIFYIMIFILFISIFLFGIEIADMIEGEDFNIIRLILLVTIVLLTLAHIKRPRAIDVYKGKTTLEITYRGDTPIDSVVVWKK